MPHHFRYIFVTFSVTSFYLVSLSGSVSFFRLRYPSVCFPRLFARITVLQFCFWFWCFGVLVLVFVSDMVFGAPSQLLSHFFNQHLNLEPQSGQRGGNNSFFLRLILRRSRAENIPVESRSRVGISSRKM